MSDKRLVVRPRYGSPDQPDTWQVVDTGRVLGTYGNREEAARHVLKLGACIALEWGRMVIGGKTEPRDFEAKHFGIAVGRVYHDRVKGHAGSAWRWSMYAHVAGRMGNANGRCAYKTEAAAEVERAFTEMLARKD
jgi:hypothetical protein